MFNRALELQVISSNPFSRVKLNKVNHTAPAFLSPEDLEKLLVHVRKKALRDIYTFLWHTGLRISELIRLKWADVDMTRGWMVIMVTKSAIQNVKECACLQPSGPTWDYGSGARRCEPPAA
jgi:integrase